MSTFVANNTSGELALSDLLPSHAAISPVRSGPDISMPPANGFEWQQLASRLSADRRRPAMRAPRVPGNDRQVVSPASCLELLGFFRASTYGLSRS